MRRKCVHRCANLKSRRPRILLRRAACRMQPATTRDREEAGGIQEDWRTALKCVKHRWRDWVWTGGFFPRLTSSGLQLREVGLIQSSLETRSHPTSMFQPMVQESGAISRDRDGGKARTSHSQADWLTRQTLLIVWNPLSSVFTRSRSANELPKP